MNSAWSYMSFGPLAALIWAVVFAMPGELPASEECPNWLARVVSVQGSLQIRREGENRWIDGKRDDALCPGDMVRVLENSRAAIVLRSEAVVRLDRNTSITLAESQTEGTVDFHFLSGLALFLSRFPFGLRIFTPFVNADIEGTELLVQVGKTETSLIVYEGKIRVGNEAGALVLGKGDAASAGAGAPPVFKTVARPRDAVQWALYYPPIPESELETLATSTDPWTEDLSASLESYRKGDLAGAFTHMEKVHPELNDSVFHAYLALLYLTVGRVEEASSRLDQAVSLDPGNSYAVSLQSIVALTKNRKEEALDLARRAAAMNPSSAAPLVALSYVQQARFDLKGALAALEEAVGLAPENAMAWTRLAEIRLSLDDLNGSHEAAARAVELNPGLSRTQTVLGFAHLARIETGEARKAFEKANGLDQADPLPRLGLGLAKIRDGDLKSGRQEIEIAVILDPGNSLMRSYLGKAYFEEKRDKHAKGQLSIAKELDPMDPTPWLYDAIRKQTVNRPVEALDDIQKSISLNDNRAVYRSRLMLDEDLAARSVSLARIYDDLGFQWAALNEAWKSVNLDPTNFSAHRFLADSYFALPRHEIARVSELLQAQLLQPLNLLPIQPQLAEARSVFHGFTGPRHPAYNEYTPLFERSQLTLLAGGMAGERGTLAEDVVLSGLYGRFSGSLGQFHGETNGVKPNNDLEQDIYDAFLQASVIPSMSLQAEYRHRDFERGDPTIYFDPIYYDIRETETSELFRFGVHQSFSPRSDLIASFMYRTADYKYDIIPYFYSQTDKESYSFEVQHLYRSESFNIISGAGHNNADHEINYKGDPERYEVVTTHSNVYVYSRLNYPQNLLWSLGLSTDFFESDNYNQDEVQVNPKFGVVWNPFPATTLRGAVFRTLEREFLNKQTIEPTQMAGFNQFMDDVNGTDSWTYGIGLDQKLSARLLAGVEFSWRDWSAPYVEPWNEVEIDERIGRAYLYWAPHPWLSVGPEYEHFQVEYPPCLPLWSLSEIETHRISLGLGFYHPSGLIARLKPTFVVQDGDIRYYPLKPTKPLDSDFLVIDASIGYRLPKRLGLIELEARNLFDKSFQYQDIDPNNPRITSGRFIVGRWTFSF